MARSREEVEQFVVDSRGKKRAVIIPIDRYERMVEDLEDLKMIIDGRDEPGSSLEEVERRLRKDGLLSG